MGNEPQSTSLPFPTQPPYTPSANSSKIKPKFLLIIILLIFFLIGVILVSVQIGNKTYNQQSNNLTPTNSHNQAFNPTTTIKSPTSTGKPITDWRLVYENRYSIEELVKKHQKYLKEVSGGSPPLFESPPTIHGKLLGPQLTDTICDSYDTNETKERLQMLVNNEWKDSCGTLSANIQFSDAPTSKLYCVEYKNWDQTIAHLDKFENCDERLQDYKKGTYRVIKGMYTDCKSPTEKYYSVHDMSWCKEYIELKSNTFELY